MNDPLIAALRIAKSGGNPSELIRQMAGRDPQMRQIMQMISGKNPQQLRQMAENMARERGTTVEKIARDLGLY
ncbi:MAG: hypothetical protein IKU94_00625 [Bacteroidaceae bacterium]|nr:hypothetical protein [Bacteroidaceae bacterium]MBR4930459.1 hypothetical protein [Bacteroidaceae bacterium]